MYKDNNKAKRNKKSLSIITNLQIKFRLETETKCMMDILLLIYIFIALHVLLHRLCFEFFSVLSLQAQGLHVCVSGTSWATSSLGNKLASITRTLLRQALHLVQKRTTRGQLKRTTHLLITSTSARRFHIILITGVIIKQDFEKNNRNPTYLAKV